MAEKGITTVVEKINKKVAINYLKTNSRNPRKTINRYRVKQYADDMRNGKWQMNGEAIVFDEDGYLKNGQHRLCAVIEADAEIEVLVVRGVSRNANIFDEGLGRTISQNLNALGYNINPHMSSAGNIIVNNFGFPRGQGVVEDYIVRNVNEFERAYRIVCYGGNGHAKSKCGPCIAAGYLALRTESLPSYELEVFFRRFNEIDTWKNDGYDISSAVVARRMFDERGTGRSGYQVQKEKLEIVVMALQDFHDGNHVEDNYRIAEPFHYTEWMNNIRRKDGLEV